MGAISKLGPDDLVMCPGTFGNPDIGEVLDLAGRHGLRGLALWGQYAALSDVKKQLRHSDVSVEIVDGPMQWSDGGLSAEDEEVLDVAVAVGAPGVSAIRFEADRVDESAAAEGFAAVCAAAAERGLWVAIEFLPWSGIPDLSTAGRIVQLSGAENGGIVLDTWHFARSGSTIAQLEEAAPLVRCLQLSDAGAVAEGDLFDETMHRRQLPGAGTIDIKAIMSVLDGAGRDYPVMMEVFNDDLLSEGSSEFIRLVVEATRAVLA